MTDVDKLTEDLSFEFIQKIRGTCRDFTREEWDNHPDHKGYVVKAMLIGMLYVLYHMLKHGIKETSDTGTVNYMCEVMRATVQAIIGLCDFGVSGDQPELPEENNN